MTVSFNNDIKQLERDHLAMVIQLQKPAEEMKATIQPYEYQIIHMFFGIVGEVAEIFGAISGNKGVATLKQLKEELGDYIFFLRALYSMNYLEEPTISDLEVNVYRTKTDTMLGFILKMGALADTLKRPIIYRKEAKQELKPILDWFYTLYYELSYRFNIHHDEILQGNMDKLLIGKNARYAEGKYTDAQANNRADKKGEVDEQL